MPPVVETPWLPDEFLLTTGPTQPDGLGAAMEGLDKPLASAAVGAGSGLRRMVNAGRAPADTAPVAEPVRPAENPGDSAADVRRGSPSTGGFAEIAPPARAPPVCRSAATEEPPGRDRAGAIWRPVASIEDRRSTRPLPPPTSRPVLVGAPATAARPARSDAGEPKSRGWAVREAPDEESGDRSRQPARTRTRRMTPDLPGSRSIGRPPCERAVKRSRLGLDAISAIVSSSVVPGNDDCCPGSDFHLAGPRRRRSVPGSAPGRLSGLPGSSGFQGEGSLRRFVMTGGPPRAVEEVWSRVGGPGRRRLTCD